MLLLPLILRVLPLERFPAGHHDGRNGPHLHADDMAAGGRPQRVAGGGLTHDEHGPAGQRPGQTLGIRRGGIIGLAIQVDIAELRDVLPE